MRPTVAEINLRALVSNYRLLQANVRRHPYLGSGLIAVIKANAYGHGLELCGRALVEAGAHWLGVTSVEEALQLRRTLGGLRQTDILVMSGFFPGEEDEVVRERLTAQVWEQWHFRLLDAAAQRAGLGPASLAVHLEIDTGMSRQGVAPGTALRELLQGLRRDSPVCVRGVLTHFSSPEQAGNGVMREQARRLKAALEQILESGIRPRFVHAGNSVNACSGRELIELGAMAEMAGAAALVRPGLALYGIEPRGTLPAASAEAAAKPKEQGLMLEPVMRWRTEVVGLRDVAAGTPVGYNETFRTPAAGARLALLPMGYADGLRRELSNRGEVLVRGCRVPIAGRVSMDQTVVNVSGLPEVAVGDEVVLLGKQDSEEIGAWEIADWCGTIPYEVTCGVSQRVRRSARD